MRFGKIWKISRSILHHVIRRSPSDSEIASRMINCLGGRTAGDVYSSAWTAEKTRDDGAMGGKKTMSSMNCFGETRRSCSFTYGRVGERRRESRSSYDYVEEVGRRESGRRQSSRVVADGDCNDDCLLMLGTVCSRREGKKQCDCSSEVGSRGNSLPCIHRYCHFQRRRPHQPTKKTN